MKRSFDIAVSLLLILFLMPLLAVIWSAVRMSLGDPVFFRQTRPGLDGKPFEMIKFRSMTQARNQDGTDRPDADRLLPFGRFLRSTSLDELPELWNVLKGDMSLVGPRPLLMAYIPLYNDTQKRRHEVRPGITGWAQISGRNALGWNERFEVDVWYVDNRSFWLDLKILWRTILIVIRRKGISSASDATMAPFKGNN